MLVNRLANQLQRAELAERNGLAALAEKFRKLAAETKTNLTRLGRPEAESTARIVASYGTPPAPAGWTEYDSPHD